jgi:hypothetical protein
MHTNMGTYQLHISKDGKRFWLPTGPPPVGRHEITHWQFEKYIMRERIWRSNVDNTKNHILDGSQTEDKIGLVQSVLKSIIRRGLAPGKEEQK